MLAQSALNAAKFTQKGEISVCASRDGEFIDIAVADTGIGMSEEQVGRLFNAFVQADALTARRYGGTGLGLALTRRIMQLLGGDVSAASVQGKGSTFTLRFPAQFGTARVLPHIDAVAAAGQGVQRLVLMIDDEESARDLTARWCVWALRCVRLQRALKALIGAQSAAEPHSA